MTRDDGVGWGEPLPSGLSTRAARWDFEGVSPARRQGTALGLSRARWPLYSFRVRGSPPNESESLADVDLAERVGMGGATAADAEAELCRRFAPRVRSYGLRHLRSEDAASELVQRVLMSMIVSLRQGDVRERDRIASFVLGTARNMAREMRRANARLEPLSEEGPWQVDAAPMYRFDRKRVAHCMGELGERERSIVALSFLEDCTAAEISASLGVSTGNVRVMRHRALTALRECFERQGEAA